MENLKEQKNCCEKDAPVKEKRGFLSGIAYGLVPHTFCILFVVFSVLGVTTATAFLKPFLLNPYFFYILIAISFVFATIAAMIYLKKSAILSFEGVKKKRKYLLILYGTTISINLLLFMVIFPITANLNFGTSFNVASTAAIGV